jgi:hypothetical protein
MAGTDVRNGKVDLAISEIIPGHLVARSGRFTAQLAIQAGQQLPRAFFDNVTDPFQLNNLVEQDVFAAEKEYLFRRLQTHHEQTPILPTPDYSFRD